MRKIVPVDQKPAAPKTVQVKNPKQTTPKTTATAKQPSTQTNATSEPNQGKQWPSRWARFDMNDDGTIAALKPQPINFNLSWLSYRFGKKIDFYHNGQYETYVKGLKWDEVPNDIWKVIFSYLPPSSLATAARVSKRWKSFLDNETWKKVCLDRWPHMDTSKDKNWKVMYRKRHEKFAEHLQGTKNLPDPILPHAIENCADFRWEFKCPLIYEDLSPIYGQLNTRSCPRCQKNVYLVESLADLNKRVDEGQCIAIGGLLDARMPTPALIPGFVRMGSMRRV